MQRPVAVFAAWLLAVAAVPVQAHHSSAMFDAQQPKSLTGTVNQFQWTNPHCYIQLVVKNERGEPENGAWRWAHPSISTTRAGGAIP